MSSERTTFQARLRAAEAQIVTLGANDKAEENDMAQGSNNEPPADNVEGHPSTLTDSAEAKEQDSALADLDSTLRAQLGAEWKGVVAEKEAELGESEFARKAAEASLANTEDSLSDSMRALEDIRVARSRLEAELEAVNRAFGETSETAREAQAEGVAALEKNVARLVEELHTAEASAREANAARTAMEKRAEDEGVAAEVAFTRELEGREAAEKAAQEAEKDGAAVRVDLEATREALEARQQELDDSRQAGLEAETALAAAEQNFEDARASMASEMEGFHKSLAESEDKVGAEVARAEAALAEVAELQEALQDTGRDGAAGEAAAAHAKAEATELRRQLDASADVRRKPRDKWCPVIMKQYSSVYVCVVAGGGCSPCSNTLWYTFACSSFEGRGGPS